MRHRIQSDSEQNPTKLKPSAISSYSVHLQGESKICDMHLLLADTFANNHESQNSTPTNLNSMQSSKVPVSSTIPLPIGPPEDKKLPPLVVVEDALPCNCDAFENDASADCPHPTARPTSLSSVASSRTSRGSGYFSSTSTSESHNQMANKAEKKSDLREEMNDAEATSNRPVLNKLVESVKEEEEQEEGFVDDDDVNFSSVNEKHFNNSSNIEKKLMNKPNLAKQRSGVSVKDINKKLSEVDHLSPIATMSMIDNPHLTYVDRIILELLETERMYVRALEDILAGYILAIKNTSLPVSSEDIEKLFLNIKDIYAFNRKFLCFLENCESDPVKIAEHFLSLDDSFSVYTKYCTNYPVAVAILTRWMKNSLLADFFKSQQASLRHNLPLGSYLLKPVQRILKYHLILQELVKNCDEEIENYWVIEHALHTMTYIARHINEMKRKHEDAVHIQEIQSLLTNWQGDDLTTYGEIVMEGELKQQGAKNERFVVLFDKMILITKRREDGFLFCKINIMCSDLILLESVKENPLSFLISPFDSPSVHNSNNHSSRGNKQYIFIAKYPDDKKLWTQNIKRQIIKNHHAAIPLHAQESIMNTETGGNDDGVDLYRKKRYSNASIDDYKRSSLKRFGTTVSASSLGFSGKGPIRRRSMSGSQKNRSPSRKQEKERKGDDIDESVSDKTNAITSGTDSSSLPKSIQPLSSEEDKPKKQEKSNNENESVKTKTDATKERKTPDKQNNEDKAKDAKVEETPKKTKKKAKAKKSEQYKKSVIYRRHKRRRGSQPVTDADKITNEQFSKQKETKEEKAKLDVTMEDFETAEDFLSFNVETNRESVSWDVQIVEAAFERYKLEKAQAEEKLRAADVDESLMIPMPNRHCYNTFTDSSGDEASSVKLESDKSKSSSNIYKPATSTTSPRDILHSSENEPEKQGSVAKLIKQNDVIVTTETDLTSIGDRKRQLLMKYNYADNQAALEHSSQPTVYEARKEYLEEVDGDPFENNCSQLVASEAKRPSLQERRKYFERLREIRERHHSQSQTFDPDSIQSGLVKGRIEQHRENITSKSVVHKTPTSPQRTSRRLSELSLTESEVGHVIACQQYFENHESERQRESSTSSESVITATPWKRERHKNTIKHPFEKEDNSHLFRIPPLRKTNYRKMEYDNEKERHSNQVTSSLPLNFTSSSDSSSSNEEEDIPDVKSPVKLKFKNFLQPQMLLWRSVSAEKGSSHRRSRNLMIEATSPKGTDLMDENRSADVRSSASSLGENTFPFKDIGKFETSENATTDKISEQVDCIWNDMETNNENVVSSSCLSDSVQDSKLGDETKAEQARFNSTKERFIVNVPPKVQTSTASVHNSPVILPNIKTDVNPKQSAIKEKIDPESPLQASQPTTQPTNRKSLETAEKQAHHKDTRRNSVLKLAQQFDKISVSTPPTTSRSYLRSRPLGGRKHLSDLRLGSSTDTTSSDLISYEEIKRQAKSSILRRNSTSAKLRVERPTSPLRKASDFTSNKARLYRRASDRIIQRLQSASSAAPENLAQTSKTSIKQNPHKQQNESEKASLQPENLEQIIKHATEKPEKAMQDTPKITKSQAHQERVQSKPETPKNETRHKKPSKIEPEQAVHKEPASYPARENDFVAPSLSLNKFYAAAKLRSSRSVAIQRPVTQFPTRPSRFNRVSTRQKKKEDLPPSDFIAAFCKV